MSIDLHLEVCFVLDFFLDPEEYPTLLHFSAHWGLERLSLQLMDCPGGDVACGLRNFAGRTPMDLADIAGHMKLANSFRNFSVIIDIQYMFEDSTNTDSFYSKCTSLPQCTIILKGSVKLHRIKSSFSPKWHIHQILVI